MMVIFAIISLLITNKNIYQQNEFKLLPFKELVVLFLGIFITMGPVLTWLEGHAGELPISTAGQFFWGAGICSGILDNAPTYLSFFSLTRGLLNDPSLVHHLRDLLSSGAYSSSSAGAFPAEIRNVLTYLTSHSGAGVDLSDRSIQIANIISNHPFYLRAISVGSVLFGALTYIGNGPNFIVKTIAEHAGVTVPSFFRYIIFYSIPVLLPIFIIVWWFWMIP
jgi:Na+/H+ antiporter NhaD/arsenite permease-like protein